MRDRSPHRRIGGRSGALTSRRRAPIARRTWRFVGPACGPRGKETAKEVVVSPATLAPGPLQEAGFTPGRQHDTTTARPAPCPRHPARPWRHAPQPPIGETSEAHVPDLRLRLPAPPSRRGALQGRASRASSIRATATRPWRCSRSASPLIEGRRGPPRHRERHGGGVRRAAVPPARRRPCRRLARAVRLLPLHRRRRCCRATASTRRWSTAPTSTPGARRCAAGRRRLSSSRRPSNPTLEIIDIAAVAELAHAAGARLVVDNVFATPLLPEAAGARRRHRRLFGDQAHRRPGPLPRRRVLGSAQFSTTSSALRPAHRPGAQPLQRLGAAEGAGDAGDARRAPGRQRRGARRLRWQAHPAR